MTGNKAIPLIFEAFDGVLTLEFFCQSVQARRVERNKFSGWRIRAQLIEYLHRDARNPIFLTVLNSNKPPANKVDQILMNLWK